MACEVVGVGVSQRAIPCSSCPRPSGRFCARPTFHWAWDDSCDAQALCSVQSPWAADRLAPLAHTQAQPTRTREHTCRTGAAQRCKPATGTATPLHHASSGFIPALDDGWTDLFLVEAQHSPIHPIRASPTSTVMFSSLRKLPFPKTQNRELAMPSVRQGRCEGFFRSM